MELGPKSWTWILAALTALGLGLWSEAGASKTVGRETVVEVLSEAGRSGKQVREVVESRGIGAADWARAIEREGPDGELARDVARRVAQGWEASGGQNAQHGDRQ